MRIPYNRDMYRSMLDTRLNQQPIQPMVQQQGTGTTGGIVPTMQPMMGNPIIQSLILKSKQGIK